MTWASFSFAKELCAIARIADGIAISECARAFYGDCVDTVTDTEPPEADRCKVCCVVLAERRLREWGIL